MKGFFGNLPHETVQNKNFRKVLYTGKHTQLVLMALDPQQEIGMETHTENDQFFRFEAGKGTCVIDGTEYPVESGTGIIVPAGAKHNIVNTSGTEMLKMYTLYSPPHHKDGIDHETKAYAEENETDFDGVTTE